MIKEDNDFIFRLCDIFIDEEKIYALPNILKFHKHNYIVRQVDDYFK